MKNFAFFAVYLCISLLTYTTLITSAETSPLKRVFSSPPLRHKFSGFLDEVLRQTPSDKFFRFIDESPELYNAATDADIYTILLSKINSIKPTFKAYSQLQALYHQQAELARQIMLLLSYKSIDGYVEIGTPGTYLSGLRKKITVTGPSYAICDISTQSRLQRLLGISSVKELLQDHQFLPLNNYDAASLDAIKDKSIEVVVCVIGLHHLPVDKIISYIRAIKRILKPGGVFILREHDVSSPDIYSLTCAAHSIYNALMLQLRVQEEQAELRNFQPLAYWIELLEAEGFTVDTQRLVQHNDPTQNTLIKSVKDISSQEAILAEIKHELVEQKDYQRPELLTYLSSPEWFNVDIAQEYGAFINHTPFYHFPYMASVKSYWHIFYNAWRVAAQRKSNWHVATSPSTLMNLFIGVTMTLEYGAKSLISAPVRWMYTGEEPVTLKVLLKDETHQIESIDKRLKVLHTYAYGIKLVEIPRYKNFLEIMRKIATTDTIELIEIAGQSRIQFKVRQLKEHTFPIDAYKGVKKEYEWDMPTQPAYRYFVLSVPVSSIKHVICALPSYNAELLYIHDF